MQICPVGALTSAAYRFRSRPFDLVSTPTVCEHCASGCSLRTDVRRSTVLRRLAWEDPAVNAEWNCDKGRFAFPYLSADRLDAPLVRDGDAAGRVLMARGRPSCGRRADRVGSAHRRPAGRQADPRGQLRLRQVRSRGAGHRQHRLPDPPLQCGRRREFLRAVVSGSGVGVTYADLDAARTVLLVGLEPEEESPIIFLRLRAATRRGGLKVLAVAPFASPGSAKLAAHVLAAAPGQEAAVLRALASGDGDAAAQVAAEGSIILVGERAAQAPGALSAVVALAEATGARLAWVPRRAGERGALEAGALAGLLPWGRPLSDPDARAQAAQAWGIDADALPAETGLDLAGVVEALAADHADAQAATAASEPTDPEPTDPAEAPADVPERRIGAVILAGVEAADAPDPQAFLEALAAAPFVLALETRSTEVTAVADVVLPVAVITEKSGTLLDWEGRARPFGQVMRDSTAITDARALSLVARAMGRPLGSIEVADLRAELAGMGRWQGPRPEALSADQPAAEAPTEAPGSGSGPPGHLAAPARRGHPPAG